MDATRDKTPRDESAGHPSAPCVWVGAGLMAFRLCDRDLDCEHCPLDAAIRGRTLPAPAPRLRPVLHYAPDRGYVGGHLWVQRQPDGTARLGIDALLATLLDLPTRVTLPRPGLALTHGEVCAAIDTGEGVLEIAAPFDGTVVAVNAALAAAPHAVVDDPYGRGWLLQAHPSEWPHTVDAAEAAHLARLDAQRFRRRVAMDLLVGTDEVGATMQDGGEPVLDLRDLVGGRRHLEIVREIVG